MKSDTNISPGATARNRMRNPKTRRSKKIEADFGNVFTTVFPFILRD